MLGPLPLRESGPEEEEIEGLPGSLRISQDHHSAESIHSYFRINRGMSES
jgi:hypothetical protein